MTCLTCKHFDLASREMAKVGYGHCAYTLVGSFFAIHHGQCEKHQSAPADVAAKRLAWANGPKNGGIVV